MTERDIEVYLREQVKAMGGKAFKWVSPGNAGVPDRIVVLPGGRILFVELKAPGGAATPLQRNQQARLRQFGFDVHQVDSKAEIDRILREAIA